ncbi:hypothetical protein GGQ68_002511 [Sagittula marina]|uniref:Uncharacterized protein n=1 Tax=Sagittula marina TaxID=943940 RepID=A0A7W6DU79_9RHOB|nr:hypothetical protein [Sagittula marina]MBB3986173.1 hypothetical protein [Sagittula marina]
MRLIFAMLLLATPLKADPELELLEACAGWSHANFMLRVADRYLENLEADISGLKSEFSGPETRELANRIIDSIADQKENLGIDGFATDYSEGICANK